MEQTTVPSRSRPPALAALAGVLGLLGAAGSGLLCLIILGLGRMDDGRWELGGWAVVLLVAAVAQAWGAVRLLRHRGWALLALGSLPALLPLLLSIAVWTEYRQPPDVLDVVAVLPVLTLVLVLLRPVRRWASSPRPR